jgi:2-polyprenyl-6-methoxyphenol hydroxylase-like FAD-dependent oxidoreductase
LNVRWFVNGGYHQPGASGISGVGISRPALESLMRVRVLALPNVRARENCDVLGLIATRTNERITGVRLIDRQAGRIEQNMPADLVVDASGRGSRSPAWLEMIGYRRPVVEEVRIGMGYTTCYFRRRPEHIPGLDGITCPAVPPNKRLGVMLAQDDNRWVVTIGGYLGDHAPTDFLGFLESVRSLPTPHLYDVIKDAEPLGEPVAYEFPANVRRRFDKLDRFPEGYLICGDALCSFNPIYAQGMTVAAMQAAALGECLARGDDQLSKCFFAKASKVIDVSWNAAVGSDLNFPEVEGRRPLMVRFLNWYIGKLHLAAHNDARVSIAFLNVINMTAQSFSLIHPAIVWRVLKGNLWPGLNKSAEIKELGLPQPELVAAERE